MPSFRKAWMPGFVDVFAVIVVDVYVFVLLLSLMFFVVLYMFFICWVAVSARWHRRQTASNVQKLFAVLCYVMGGFCFCCCVCFAVFSWHCWCCCCGAVLCCGVLVCYTGVRNWKNVITNVLSKKTFKWIHQVVNNVSSNNNKHHKTHKKEPWTILGPWISSGGRGHSRSTSEIDSRGWELRGPSMA